MTRRLILWIGLLLYVASFFLVAIRHSFTGITMRGYECAGATFVSPWQSEAAFDGRLDFLSTIISGWINPVFLITAILVFFGRPQRLITVMRILVVLMVPLCWVVFHYAGAYPGVGHFVWIVGMLVTLFSRDIGGSEVPKSPA